MDKDSIARLVMFIEHHVETNRSVTIAKCKSTEVFWLYWRDQEGKQFLVHPALGAFEVSHELLHDHFKLHHKQCRYLLVLGVHFELHGVGSNYATDKLKYRLPGLSKLKKRGDGRYIDCVTGDHISIRHQMRTEVIPDRNFNAETVSEEVIIGVKVPTRPVKDGDVYNQDFIIRPESHLLYRLVETPVK